MPVIISDVTPKARALLTALREARTRCRITSRDLSLKLGYSHGVVSHWETGRRVPAPADVAALLGALGIIGPDHDRILTLAHAAAEPNWLTVGIPGLPRHIADAIDCERSANAIIEWAPATIPGLLQVSDYTRALCVASDHTPPEVESCVMVQPGRREAITRTTRPITFTALISEAALREPIGTTEVMAEQLHYLVDLAARPNITLRIIPQFVGWHPGLAGPFAVYHFPDAADVARFQHVHASEVTTDTDRAARCRDAITIVAAKALGSDESVDYVANIANRWTHPARSGPLTHSGPSVTVHLGHGMSPRTASLQAGA